MFSTFNRLACFLALALVSHRACAATCNVVPSGKDDHDAILKALGKCANKGTVRFPAGNNYILASPITEDEADELELSKTQIVIDGNIDYEYDGVGDGDQSDTIYWTITGTNVDISGTGRIKGHGQQWYNEGQHGPKLMGLKIDQGSLSDLTFNNGGGHVLILGGNDFVVKNVTIHSVSNDYENAYPANTDGININGQRITVKNTDIIAGDDCISFLNKADTIHINNVRCGGPTHGISVGNLGSKSGDTETVKNILVENVEFYDGGLQQDWPDFAASQFIARIKTYGNAGSKGSITNVTWQHITVSSKLGISPSGKTAVYVTQNHDSGEEQDPAHSGIKITDITFSDISGGKIPKADQYGSVSITCSGDHKCENIVIEDIDFKNAPDHTCTNVKGLNEDCEED